MYMSNRFARRVLVVLYATDLQRYTGPGLPSVVPPAFGGGVRVAGRKLRSIREIATRAGGGRGAHRRGLDGSLANGAHYRGYLSDQVFHVLSANVQHLVLNRVGNGVSWCLLSCVASYHGCATVVGGRGGAGHDPNP